MRNRAKKYATYFSYAFCFVFSEKLECEKILKLSIRCAFYYWVLPLLDQVLLSICYLILRAFIECL